MLSIAFLFDAGLFVLTSACFLVNAGHFVSLDGEASREIC